MLGLALYSLLFVYPRMSDTHTNHLCTAALQPEPAANLGFYFLMARFHSALSIVRHRHPCGLGKQTSPVAPCGAASSRSPNNQSNTHNMYRNRTSCHVRYELFYLT